MAAPTRLPPPSTRAIVTADEDGRDSKTTDPGTPLGGEVTNVAGLGSAGDLAVGDIVDKRYRIVGAGIEGGMGVVYPVDHLELNERQALKLLHSHVLDRPGAVERFRQEAQLARGLQHPGIVRVWDFGKWEGRPYLAMEWVEGGTLRQELRRQEQQLGRAVPALARTIEVVEQLAEAVAYAHRQGIVHRDLKPENVLLDGPRVKIADFGIARIMAPGQQVTASQGSGTPSYMAPEQVRGEPGGEQADIYSLGVMLYELLCGVRPGGRFPMPHERDPQVPAGLDGVLVRCLAMDPGARFRSVDEFLVEFRAAVGRGPAPSPAADSGGDAREAPAVTGLAAPTRAAPARQGVAPSPLSLAVVLAVLALPAAWFGKTLAVHRVWAAYASELANISGVPRLVIWAVALGLAALLYRASRIALGVSPGWGPWSGLPMRAAAAVALAVFVIAYAAGYQWLSAATMPADHVVPVAASGTASTERPAVASEKVAATVSAPAEGQRPAPRVPDGVVGTPRPPSSVPASPAPATGVSELTHVRSRPPGAEVYLDWKSIGRTPVALPGADAHGLLMVTRDGYRAAFRSLQRGQRDDIELVLQPDEPRPRSRVLLILAGGAPDDAFASIRTQLIEGGFSVTGAEENAAFRRELDRAGGVSAPLRAWARARFDIDVVLIASLQESSRTMSDQDVSYLGIREAGRTVTRSDVTLDLEMVDLNTGDALATGSARAAGFALNPVQSRQKAVTQAAGDALKALQERLRRSG